MFLAMLFLGVSICEELSVFYESIVYYKCTIYETKDGFDSPWIVKIVWLFFVVHEPNTFIVSQWVHCPTYSEGSSVTCKVVSEMFIIYTCYLMTVPFLQLSYTFKWVR